LPPSDATESSSFLFQTALRNERREESPSLLRLCRRLYGWEILGFATWSALNKLIGLLNPYLIKVMIYIYIYISLSCIACMSFVSYSCLFPVHPDCVSILPAIISIRSMVLFCGGDCRVIYIYIYIW
jgi:hypothetical protein